MLQEITKGDPETVRRINEMVRAVNHLDRMTGDGLVNVSRTPAGVALTLNMAAVQARIPQNITSDIRKAYMIGNAGAGTTADCHLDTDGTGETVTVNFSIANGSSLNDAVPRLKDGNLIFVENFDGDWYCTGLPLQGSEDCVCEAT